MTACFRRTIGSLFLGMSLTSLAMAQGTPFSSVGLLDLKQIQAKVEASPAKYDVQPAPSDSILVLAMKYLYPLVRGYTIEPHVTLVGGGRRVTESEYPGMNLDLLVEAEHEFLVQHWSAARDRYRKILKKAPSWYLGYSKLGEVFAREKNTDSAIAYCQKAIAMNPYDYSPYLVMADEFYRVKRYSQARNAMIELLTLRPRYLLARKHLRDMTELPAVVRDSIFAPRSYATVDDEVVQIRYPANQGTGSPWKWYAMTKGIEREDDELRASLCGSKTMGWCERGEYQCLTALIESYEASKSKLRIDSTIETLKSIEHDGLLHGFMLYEIVSRMDEDITLEAEDSDRDAVRKYVAKYILPLK